MASQPSYRRSNLSEATLPTVLQEHERKEGTDSFCATIGIYALGLRRERGTPRAWRVAGWPWVAHGGDGQELIGELRMPRASP